MFNTAFKGITTLSRNALFYGGICKWYYAKVEDVVEWPVVNPVTQEYATQPVLREGAVWYGPVKVPDGSLGLNQVEKEIASGTYFEIKIELTQPGDERNSRANLRNLGLHRYVAVAKTRAGGMFVVVGSPQSPLKLRREYSTGSGKNGTAGARLVMATESKDPCIALASFDGVNSLPPNNSSYIIQQPIMRVFEFKVQPGGELEDSGGEDVQYTHPSLPTNSDPQVYVDGRLLSYLPGNGRYVEYIRADKLITFKGGVYDSEIIAAFK